VPPDGRSALEWGAPVNSSSVALGTPVLAKWSHPLEPRFPVGTPSAIDNYRCVANGAFKIHLHTPNGATRLIYTTNQTEYCPPRSAVLDFTVFPTEVGPHYFRATAGDLQLGPIAAFHVFLPNCSLTSVLESLPPNTASGTCSNTLPAGSSCTLACVSRYQLVSGAHYSCSSTGVLSGGQTCADPVCANTGPGHEVTVQLEGGQYTGPLSASHGSVIQVAGSMPYAGLAEEVVGSLAFDGTGSTPCTADTAVVNTKSVGSCFLAVPNFGSQFALTVNFVYQKDWCTKFVGTVVANLTLVDLARLQLVADSAQSAVAAEVVRATTKESALDAADAALGGTLANETARALAAEGVLRADVASLSMRMNASEQAEASFIFHGLQSGIDVTYPQGKQPGTGVASQLNQRIVFDQSLSSRGVAIRYNVTTGVVSIVQAGSYRLDAFVHLYSQQGSSAIGTGVVSWMTVENAPKPIGPSIFNPNAAGVPQGTLGDNTFVSTLVNVPEGTSVANPFTAQCVLVSMNQRKNQITDASVISITKLK